MGAGAVRFGLGLVLVAWVAWGGAAASAQRAAGQSPEYHQLIARALDEYERGHWDEAAGLFERAHKLYPNARTLRGMGIAAFEGRRYVRALEYLAAALSSAVNPLTAAQRSEVQDVVARAEDYVARLEIVVQPSDAEVQVDDVMMPAGPNPRVTRLDPGLVLVRVSAEGHAPVMRQVRLVSGARETLNVQLERSAGAAPEAIPAAAAPSRPPPTAIDSAPAHGPEFYAWKWIALGVGGAALIAGGVSHAQREIAASDYNADELCGEDESAPDVRKRCVSYRDDVDDATLRMAIGYATGGVLIGAAIVMFALEGGGDDASDSAAACSVDGAGASCRVRF